MYQEVCFNRGTEAGGRGVNVGHSVSPPPGHFMPATGLLWVWRYSANWTTRDYNNFCDTLGFLNLTKKRNSESFFFLLALKIAI